MKIKHLTLLQEIWSFTLNFIRKEVRSKQQFCSDVSTHPWTPLMQQPPPRLQRLVSLSHLRRLNWAPQPWQTFPPGWRKLEWRSSWWKVWECLGAVLLLFPYRTFPCGWGKISTRRNVASSTEIRGRIKGVSVLLWSAFRCVSPLWTCTEQLA